MANRKVTPLTNTEIQASKPKEKEYTLSDGNGLQLVVKIDGKKIWEVRYTVNGKPKQTTIGSYPIITLAMARSKRDEMKNKVVNGIDPIKERKETKELIQQDQEIQKVLDLSQFHLVAQDWCNSIIVSDDTRARKMRALERDIFPYFCTYNDKKHLISSKPISEITHGEMIKALKDKAITSSETANKLFTDLNRIWLYAISHNYAQFNIMANISKRDTIPKKEVVHIPKITDEMILGEMLRAIENYTGGRIMRSLLMFVALVPLRADNLCCLRWSQVDLDKKLITISRNEMKVDDSNLSDFVLPLSNQALLILQELKELTGWGEWVFHGAKNSLDHINKESPNKALRLLGFNDEVRGRKQTLHGFRGTFRSLAETYSDKHNADFTTMERVLDHHDKSGVVRAYNHKANYVEKMKPLLQWWADYLDEVKNDQKN